MRGDARLKITRRSASLRMPQRRFSAIAKMITAAIFPSEVRVRMPPLPDAPSSRFRMGFKRFVVLLSAGVLAACGPSDGHEKGGSGHGPMGGMPPPEVTVTTATQEALPVTW